MGEPKQFVFPFREFATILVKHQNLHEGHWGIFVRFGLQATNVGAGPEGNELFPSAIVPIVELGLQRFDAPNALTVDAAEVNPMSASRRKATSRAAK